MTDNPCKRSRRCRAFTLIEILVVVLLLGILASIVIVRIKSPSDDAKRSVFTQNLRSFQQGLSLYRTSLNHYPPNAASGVCPDELVGYVDATAFAQPTPLGGSWDVETNASGILLGIGVHFNGAESQDDAFMVQIDRMLDDGDLATGYFRKLAADRYYAVLE